jgi:hypothetical protein
MPAKNARGRPPLRANWVAGMSRDVMRNPSDRNSVVGGVRLLQDVSHEICHIVVVFLIHRVPNRTAAIHTGQ